MYADEMAIQLTKLEKLLLPAFLILFEVVFIIVYGLVVDYDEGGSPDHELEVALQLLQNSSSVSAEEYVLSLASTRGTTKVYPCKLHGDRVSFPDLFACMRSAVRMHLCIVSSVT